MSLPSAEAWLRAIHLIQMFRQGKHLEVANSKQFRTCVCSHVCFSIHARPYTPSSCSSSLILVLFSTIHHFLLLIFSLHTSLIYYVVLLSLFFLPCTFPPPLISFPPPVIGWTEGSSA
ncbi:hypothetical protein AMECASPLE_008237, partial [Ameca splendens]